MTRKIDTYTIDDATHFLRCSHCIGATVRRNYLMACLILSSENKNGKVKILVFGDRDWAGRDDRKRIRYVSENRLIKASFSGIEYDNDAGRSMELQDDWSWTS